MKVVNKKMCVIIILMLVIIESCTIFLMYKSYSAKETKLDEVNLQGANSNMFAIMLEQEDGTYKEDTSSIWPSDGTYVYDEEKSGCIDANGNKIDNALDFDFANNIANVETGSTSYCYLYFSKPLNLYELCEETENMSECLIQRENRVYMVNNVTDEITGEMYRYQGTKDKVIDNYICFGTSDAIECLSNTDKYLYRILGFDSNGYLKLIKQTVLPSTYSNNQALWGNSALYIGINDSYFLNAIDENNEKIYIPTEWEDKILAWDWKYGHVHSSEYWSNAINLELTFANLVNAKIGLMYIHDYYLAFSNTATCMNGNTSCQNNWLYTGNHERILTSGTSDHVWTIQTDSSLWWYWYGSSFYIRPVFYLNNILKIYSGSGTIEDPFIIS